jgi:hypothetical protein
MPAIPTATDKDLREFRWILSQQRRIQLDHWQGASLRKILRQLNRALGNPQRIQRAVQAAVLGTYRSGKAVSAWHGISITTQFLRILTEYVRSGIFLKNFIFTSSTFPTAGVPGCGISLL